MRFTSSIEVETVDAADELDIGRAPRRVGTHTAHIFVDRRLDGRVVPRQRQPHHARLDLHLGQISELVLDLPKRGDQILERRKPRVVVDLQGADAWREIHDAK